MYKGIEHMVFYDDQLKKKRKPVVMMVWLFANGPGDRGSIQGQVIPKTQKMVLDASSLKNQYYKLRIKGKWSNPRKGIAPSLTLCCSSY